MAFSMAMCDVACPHCEPHEDISDGLMRCVVRDTYSHLLTETMADVCLSGPIAVARHMLTLPEWIDRENVRNGFAQSDEQLTLPL